MVRYRTADFACLTPNRRRCECGVPLRKMSRVRGRLDDMLILASGQNLYPDEIDRAVLSVPGVIDYQLVIAEDGYRDVLQLTVEANEPSNSLADLLLQALLTIASIKNSYAVARALTFGRIELVPPGTLSKGRFKSIRIVDNRARPTGIRSASMPVTCQRSPAVKPAPLVSSDDV